jgi:hypothetical protein
MKFVVNPGGVVHGVADEEVETLVRERGMRLATGEETQEYFRLQGLDEDGRPHPDTMKAIEEANERRRLHENVRQENAPTEAFATHSSDSPLAKVREAKRQRVLSVEATLTPTNPLEAHVAGLNKQIADHQAVIDEANAANKEALDTFDIDPNLPASTNQAAWLGSAEPKVVEGQVPTIAHPAETDQTVGDKIASSDDGKAKGRK